MKRIMLAFLLFSSTAYAADSAELYSWDQAFNASIAKHMAGDFEGSSAEWDKHADYVRQRDLIRLQGEQVQKYHFSGETAPLVAPAPQVFVPGANSPLSEYLKAFGNQGR